MNEWCEAPKIVELRGLARRSRRLRFYGRGWTLNMATAPADEFDDMSDDEIEQMVRDAEANAAADEERKSLVEARNEIDGLVFSTEKNLEEHGEKLSEELKKEIVEEAAALSKMTNP